MVSAFARTQGVAWNDMTPDFRCAVKTHCACSREAGRPTLELDTDALAGIPEGTSCSAAQRVVTTAGGIETHTVAVFIEKSTGR